MSEGEREARAFEVSGGTETGEGTISGSRRAASQARGTPAASPAAAPRRKPRRVIPCQPGGEEDMEGFRRGQGASLGEYSWMISRARTEIQPIGGGERPAPRRGG